MGIIMFFRASKMIINGIFFSPLHIDGNFRCFGRFSTLEREKDMRGTLTFFLPTYWFDTADVLGEHSS